MKKNLFAIALLFILAACLTAPLLAGAQSPSKDLFTTTNLPKAYQNQNIDLIKTVVSILSFILGLLGLAAVIIIIYAGFKYMTAAGEKEKITRAKSILIAGIIGLAIIILSYAIAQQVFKLIIPSSPPSSPQAEVQPGDVWDL